MGTSKMNKKQAKARQRAQLIMKVRCGLMSASEAAAAMGVSRKTYYKWEQRGLSALLDGLSDQQPGRPEKPDTTAEQILEKQLAELRRENQLLEKKMVLKDLATEYNLRSKKDRAKKK
jgi:transposase